MKLKVLIGFLVLLIILNLATIGTFLYVHFTRSAPRHAGWTGPRPGMHASSDVREGTGERMRFHAHEREELMVLLTQFREDTKQLRDRARDLERKTFDLMQEDAVPVEKVDSLLKEISIVQYEISKEATAKLIEAKKVLSPEQQKHFFEAIHRSHLMTHGQPRHPRAGRIMRQGRRPHHPDSTGRE